MTDNIHSFTATPKPKRKGKNKGVAGPKAVTIFYGENWGIRFANNEPRLMMGPKTVERLVEETTQRIKLAEAPKAVPAAASKPAGPVQDREALIATLGLDDVTVARIDTNARMLGLSFASAIAGELVQ